MGGEVVRRVRQRIAAAAIAVARIEPAVGANTHDLGGEDDEEAAVLVLHDRPHVAVARVTRPLGAALLAPPRVERAVGAHPLEAEGPRLLRGRDQVRLDRAAIAKDQRLDGAISLAGDRRGVEGRIDLAVRERLSLRLKNLQGRTSRRIARQRNARRSPSCWPCEILARAADGNRHPSVMLQIGNISATRARPPCHRGRKLCRAGTSPRASRPGRSSCGWWRDA